jgi:hypothetical protein
MAQISAGRCARVSYLTHEGRRDPVADIELCERLLQAGHMSPAEHPARAFTEEERAVAVEAANWFARLAEAATSEEMQTRYLELERAAWFCGNFQGFRQLRKMIPGEAVFTGGTS